MKIVRRFALPLLLLVGAIIAFVLSSQFGATAPPAIAARSVGLETPLFSVRRLPEAVASAHQAEALAAVVPPEPLDLSSLSCAIVLIDGVPIYEIRADQDLVGGHSQLLLTAHTALDQLPNGADFVFTTSVLGLTAPNDDGVVPGGLWLVGGGDPVLMTYNFSRSFRPVLSTHTSFEGLADAVVEAGVSRVDGGVIGVERRYDDERLLGGWPDDAITSGFVGPMSALQVNDGLTDRAAANGGVALGAERPALFAAALFDDLLEDRGVQIAGLSLEPGVDEQLPDLVPIAEVTSAPLGDIVFQMLAVNDASAAEMLLKEVGFARTSQGTTRAGADVVRDVATDLGVEMQLAPRDASGLDQVSTTTCRQLANFADAIPAFHDTIATMPAYDLPAVFGGRLVDAEIEADLRVVGGVVGKSSGLVARTVGGDRQVVVATIVNRTGGPSASDLVFQADVLKSVDSLLIADLTGLIEASPAGDE